MPRPNMEMGMKGCGMTMMGRRRWSAPASTATTTSTCAMNITTPTRLRFGLITSSRAATTCGRATPSAARTASCPRTCRLRRASRQLLATGQHCLEPRYQSAHGQHGSDRRLAPVDASLVGEQRGQRHRQRAGNSGRRLRRARRVWRALVQRAGLFGMGDTFAATPMHAWDTVWRPRSVELAARPPQPQVRRQLPILYLANVGILPESWLLPVHQRLHDADGHQRWHRSALASFLLGLPAVKQRQAGIPQMQLRQWYADGFVQDSFQLTRNTTIEMGLRYEYMSPLTDIRYPNTNLMFQNGVPSVFVGGQQGYPTGLKYSNKLNFAPRFGISHNIPRPRDGATRGVWHLLYAGGHEHLVQSASQCSLCFPGNPAERQLHSTCGIGRFPVQLRPAGAGPDNCKLRLD